MPSKPHSVSAPTAPASFMLTGLAASSGIARGEAFVCAESILVPRRLIEAAEIDAELARLDKAVGDVEQELLAIRIETRRKLGAESAAIFEAQACLLRDPALCHATQQRCRRE